MPIGDALYSAPAALRNREPILEVLRQHLPEHGRVLEIASGSGEHAVFLAAALPGVEWRPSERDADGVAMVAARRAAEGPVNLLAPIHLDAADTSTWPDETFDAVVCINMIHVSPWAATEGLMRGAAQVLKPGGVLYLYGPYREAGRPFAPSNQAFDDSLKARDPSWGIRELDAVAALAARHGMNLAARVEMPANNLSVVFAKGG
ncbi:MAG: DUF938 domain-containing protein [Caulobacteraceae bacterium]